MISNGMVRSSSSLDNYIIIKESLPINLAYEVNRMMTQGYRPIGGIAASYNPSKGNMYYQAMIKGEEN